VRTKLDKAKILEKSKLIFLSALVGMAFGSFLSSRAAKEEQARLRNYEIGLDRMFQELLRASTENRPPRHPGQLFAGEKAVTFEFRSGNAVWKVACDETDKQNQCTLNGVEKTQ